MNKLNYYEINLYKSENKSDSERGGVLRVAIDVDEVLRVLAPLVGVEASAGAPLLDRPLATLGNLGHLLGLFFGQPLLLLGLEPVLLLFLLFPVAMHSRGRTAQRRWSR